MEFCDNCGKLLIVKKVGSCSCGFSKEITKELVVSEQIQKVRKKGEGIIDSENENRKEMEGFPHDCKKCGHGEASVSEVKTGYSDEADIYIFKCKKCGFVERQADGCSNM
ncbi:MAG: hypothetical protein WC796_06345 [Candidatus Pacearchaeota archaeon]|jgi:DNA-directed RNA polymerase subunit M/transcription elongation factor TFIIS